MKKLYLLILLSVGMTLGSYSYAQKASNKQNCVELYNSGLQRSDDVMEVNAENVDSRAKILESLHKDGYFYKEVSEKIQKLSFGATKKYTAIKYTITDLGKKHRKISNKDLVHDIWYFCK